MESLDSQTANFVEALLQAYQAYIPKLEEYRTLAFCSDLTDDEVERLAAIYTAAEQDPLLNFFINELDYVWGERLGLLNQEFMNEYENQQAWLREHLEQTLFEQGYRLEIQQLLQTSGFYKGPIDGVWGDRSIEAMTKFRMEMQRRLRAQGFYNGPIDGEFGEKSVMAVIKFQQSHDLKDDGVLGKQTFSALQSKWTS